MKFRWTIPNILTIFRVVLIPAIVYSILQDSLPGMIVALALLADSALTDALDGLIARKLNQTSEFGAHFDPLADKFLVWALFTVFAFLPGLMIPWWLVLFIYLRDFFVTFLRMYSRRRGIRFKTSLLAKTKTSVQMSVAFVITLYMTVTAMIRKSGPVSDYESVWRSVSTDLAGWIARVPFVLTALAVIFTLVTAVDYYRTFRLKRDLK